MLIANMSYLYPISKLYFSFVFVRGKKESGRNLMKRKENNIEICNGKCRKTNKLARVPICFMALLFIHKLLKKSLEI